MTDEKKNGVEPSLEQFGTIILYGNIFKKLMAYNRFIMFLECNYELVTHEDTEEVDVIEHSPEKVTELLLKVLERLPPEDDKDAAEITEHLNDLQL